MPKLIYVLSILCFASLALPALSTADPSDPGTLEEAQKQIAELKHDVKDLKEINKRLSAKVGSFTRSPEYRGALINYHKKLMEYAIEVYSWHRKATQTIHKTTMVLVVTAMVVSVAQIIFGMVFYRRADGHTKQQREMLELSTTRIKITTTVSGMILLLITLAFFYVYVQDVYEIKLPPQQFVDSK